MGIAYRSTQHLDRFALLGLVTLSLCCQEEVGCLDRTHQPNPSLLIWFLVVTVTWQRLRYGLTCKLRMDARAPWLHFVAEIMSTE